MNLFQNYLVEEFAEDYQEGHLSRREALKLIAGVSGSLIFANAILAACAPPPETSVNSPVASQTASAASTPLPTELAIESAAPTHTEPPADPPVTVAADDPAVEAVAVEFSGDDGANLLGYLARPAVENRLPVVLVCHENRGLTFHIQDVTRRLAKAGYAALAVDLLSRQGGIGSFSSDDVPGALGNIDPEQFAADFRSGWGFLQGQAFAQAEKVGMVGFCFGGGVTWLAATHMPELLAAVPFYGPHPPVEDVPNIRAAVLAIYAGNDNRINQGIPAIEEAMRLNNKVFEKVIFPGVDHAFHNDTGQRYNAEAAKDAWSRTLAWFEKYLT